MAEQESRSERTRRRRAEVMESAPTEVQAKYIKSVASPVLHADGMFGGITPSGQIYIAIFAEHSQIPDAATLRRQPGEEVFKPVESDIQFPGTVRDIGVEVIMTLPVARAFRDWLNDRLKQIDDLGLDDLKTPSETEEPQT